MNMDLEDQLRLDMERATRDIRVPRGLALKADRHRRKRRTTLRMATAAATAAVLVGGVAIAGVTGTFGSAPSPASIRSAQLTAYVVRHMQSALAPAAIDTVVGSVRQTYPPGTTVELVPGGLNVLKGGSGAASRLSVGYSVLWAYQRTTRYAAYTASGRPVFDAVLTHPKTGATETAVIYPSSTWWTAPVRTHNPGPAGCMQNGGIYLRPGHGGGWPGFIRSQLACGAYTVVGHQIIDGIDAIELTRSAVGPAGPLRLWVDPATYLPLQMTIGPLHWAFQWLPATPANLAQLHVSVPASFRQVQPPLPNPGS